MKDRSVFLTMARPAAHGTLSARTRPAHHVTQRTSLAQSPQHARAASLAAHAVSHCNMAATPHKLQSGLHCSSMLFCRLRCRVAFGCHMLASFLAPLPAAPLPNCLHNCCFLLLAASGVLFASNLLPHFLLVPLRTMWSGPHSACMRVAACRRAPHAAWHVSENWRAIG